MGRRLSYLNDYGENFNKIETSLFWGGFFMYTELNCLHPLNWGGPPMFTSTEFLLANCFFLVIGIVIGMFIYRMGSIDSIRETIKAMLPGLRTTYMVTDDFDDEDFDDDEDEDENDEIIPKNPPNKLWRGK